MSTLPTRTPYGKMHGVACLEFMQLSTRIEHIIYKNKIFLPRSYLASSTVLLAMSLRSIKVPAGLRLNARRYDFAIFMLVYVTGIDMNRGTHLQLCRRVEPIC